MNELDEALERIERVRALCVKRMTEDVNGALTDAEVLWPSEVLAAIAGTPRWLVEDEKKW